MGLSAGAFAQVTDGWQSDGGPGSPTLSNSTTGATLGLSSLKSTVPQGNFWGPSTGNLLAATGASNANVPAQQLSNLENATKISYDIEMDNNSLNGGGPGATSGFNGFAQVNELEISLFAPNGGSLPSGTNQFIQLGFAAANGTDSLGQNAGWNGVDGERTITYDLTKFMATDPNPPGGGAATTVTVAQFLLNHPDLPDFKIGIVEQVGNATQTIGPASMYFDNVKLLNSSGATLSTIGNFEAAQSPEPASLALLGFAVPAMVLRRRRA